MHIRQFSRSRNSALFLDRPGCHAGRRRNGLNSGVRVNKDGRDWRIGTAGDVG
jgi:hypothetical protein